jgi:hypothetical protein
MYYNSDRSQRRRESAMFGLGWTQPGIVGTGSAVIMPSWSQKLIYQWEQEQRDLQKRLMEAQIAQTQEATRAQALSTQITQTQFTQPPPGPSSVDISLLQKQYEDALKKQQQDLADYYANLIKQTGGDVTGPTYQTVYGGPTSPVPSYQPMPGDFEDVPTRDAGRITMPEPPLPGEQKPGTNWWALFIESVDAYVGHWERKK